MAFTYVYILQSEVDHATARGRTGKVFEVAFRPRIPEEAPVNLQSLAGAKVPRPACHAGALAEARA